VIYHFPRTDRPGKRDASETAALISCGELGLPLFVITHSDGGRTRTVIQGKIIDVDRQGAVVLISFDLNEPVLSAAATEPFRLEASRKEKKAAAQRLVRNARFKFAVAKRVGWGCAV
jgi:hypothetical protein